MISSFLRDNNLEEIEIKIDKITFNGFDNHLDSNLVTEAIIDELSSFFSRYVQSSIMKNRKRNIQQNGNELPSYVSISQINAGYFIQSSNKQDSAKLGTDVGRVIARGLMSSAIE